MVTSRRRGVAALGLAMVAVGLLLPRDWYDALPWDPKIPHPPIKGVTLLQASIVIEGILVGLFAWTGWQGKWGSARLQGTRSDTHVDPTFDVSQRTATLLLGAITALALSLRLIHLNDDLWIDEISTVIAFGKLTPFQVVTRYLTSNNHMLNTILINGATRLFGEREWAIRLPAVLFGVAGVPVLYWLARLAASRLESLGIALLLAVSYHHIFFSQNARGYTGYLFFSMLATGLFVRGMLRDQRDTWIAYVLASFANFVALLHSIFVFAAHTLIGVGAAMAQHLRGQNSGPLFRRLWLVLGVTALLGFQLWATVLPQAYATVRGTYATPGSGFAITSLEFVNDLLSGLREGFGAALVLLLPAMLLGGYGFLILLRRQWILGTALVLPLVLTAAAAVFGSLTSEPRFFLLGLPLAAFAVVLGLSEAARLLVARLAPTRPALAPRLAGTTIGILTLASLAALPRYYSVPKQPYRMAVAYANEHRPPGDIIVLLYTVEHGFRYYAGGTGLKEGRDFVALRTVPALDTVVRANGANHLMMITSFTRALRLDKPELYARLQAGWAPVKVFSATIHDGEITIWLPRAS